MESSSTSTPSSRMRCRARARCRVARTRLRPIDGSRRRRSAALRRPLGVVAGAHERARLDVARSPRPSANAPSSANSSGVHHRATGRCRRDGRRYWPRVRTSTPTLRRSAIAPRTSSAVSPMPEDDPRLRRRRPGVLGPRRAARASGRSAADGRAARCRRATVSRLWFSTSGRAAKITSSASAIALAVGDEHLDPRVAGDRARTAAIVAAKPAAPPSARSSRATLVITACSSPSCATASATRPGSSGSSGSGLRVSTRQKPHARVQRSPRIMNVAVRSAQHS